MAFFHCGTGKQKTYFFRLTKFACRKQAIFPSKWIIIWENVFTNRKKNSFNTKLRTLTQTIWQLQIKRQIIYSYLVRFKNGLNWIFFCWTFLYFARLSQIYETILFGWVFRTSWQFLIISAWLVNKLFWIVLITNNLSRIFERAKSNFFSTNLCSDRSSRIGLSHEHENDLQTMVRVIFVDLMTFNSIWFPFERLSSVRSLNFHPFARSHVSNRLYLWRTLYPNAQNFPHFSFVFVVHFYSLQ